MTDNPKAEPTLPGEREISAPVIIAAAFLALHIVPIFWRPNPLWGVDFLFYLPTPVQVLFVPLAVLMFISAFHRQIRAGARKLPLALWGRGRRVRATRMLVAICSLAVFVVLSSASHLLGDGYGLLIKLEGGNWPDRFRAPLAYALIDSLYHVGSALRISAENTYRIYSYISGILFVLLAFPVASTLGKSNRDKSLVLAFLLSAGYMQQFFGYVENYALNMPCILLYILVGLHSLRQRLPLYVPALVLGVLLALHPALAVFGPSLLVLAYHACRDRHDRVTPWKNITATFASLCCTPICTLLLLWLTGTGVDVYMGGIGSEDFLPVFAEPGFNDQYRAFSLAHFVDLINQQLLAAPAACMMLFLLRKKDLRHQPFLALCTVVPLFFTFTANPGIGAFRDWDIFSIPALPLTLWTSTMVLNRNREPRTHGVLTICKAATLHTLLWIGLNANAEAAEARFVQQADRLDKNAGSYSWSTLGNYYGSKGENNLALNAYKRAIEASPENPWNLLSIGKVYRSLGKEQLAIDHMNRALEIRPDFVEGHNSLAITYYLTGRHSLAIEHLRKAIELQPDRADGYMTLGVVFSDLGQFDTAIDAFKTAITVEPELAEAHANLGAVYRQLGRTDNAIEALETALALQPRHAAAIANLGAAYRDAGQNGNAIKYLKEAIALQTDDPVPYADLGFIYKSKGNYTAAVENFEKALQLQGTQANAMANLNIGDTYYKMSEPERAVPYLQKAIQLAPKTADAHLLLGLSYRALNRDVQAGVYFKKTLELEPDHPQAARIRQWLDQIHE